MTNEADATRVTLTSVLVQGQLRWFGYVVRCPVHFASGPCGNTRNWRLHLSRLSFPSGHSPGVFAELECTRCLHRFGHVLVYPEMVEALVVAAHGEPIDELNALRVLAGIGWRPHADDYEFPDPHDTSASPDFQDHGIIKGYVPWEDFLDHYLGYSAWNSPWEWWWEWHPRLMAAVAGRSEVPRPQPPKVLHLLQLPPA